jgi:hypothetical protein
VADREWRVAAIAVLTALGAGLAGARASEASVTMICVNPASGTSWRVVIDYGKGTVDSNPAQIGGATISWHEPRDGGNYTLDRKSGALTMVVASSTGGYFLHYTCKPGT